MTLQDIDFELTPTNYLARVVLAQHDHGDGPVCMPHWLCMSAFDKAEAHEVLKGWLASNKKTMDQLTPAILESSDYKSWKAREVRAARARGDLS